MYYTVKITAIKDKIKMMSAIRNLCGCSLPKAKEITEIGNLIPVDRSAFDYRWEPWDWDKGDVEMQLVASGISLDDVEISEHKTQKEIKEEEEQKAKQAKIDEMNDWFYSLSKEMQDQIKKYIDVMGYISYHGPATAGTPFCGPTADIEE